MSNSFYGKKKQTPLAKTNGFLGEQMGDQKNCENVCLYMCRWPFYLLHGLETPLESGYIEDLFLVPLLGVETTPRRIYGSLIS